MYVTSISFTDAQAEKLKTVKDKYGMPLNAQIRLALIDWFAKDFAVDADADFNVAANQIREREVRQQQPQQNTSIVATRKPSAIRRDVLLAPRPDLEQEESTQ